jgi:Tripartite tricarboxylate transporter family receptor
LQGIAQVGSIDHIAGAQLQSSMGTRWQFALYRGAAPMMQDLVAGNVDWGIRDTSLPQIRAGRIRAYAVAAPIRLAVAPDIPTVDEAGLPKFYVSLWLGLWAPKGTPKEIVAKLNAAVVATLAEPENGPTPQVYSAGLKGILDAQILSAFDISFVSAQNRSLAVAASRIVGSGEPFGVVIIAVFCASDDSAWLTGERLTAAGGYR